MKFSVPNPLPCWAPPQKKILATPLLCCKIIGTPRYSKIGIYRLIKKNWTNALVATIFVRFWRSLSIVAIHSWRTFYWSEKGWSARKICQEFPNSTMMPKITCERIKKWWFVPKKKKCSTYPSLEGCYYVVFCPILKNLYSFFRAHPQLSFES